MMQIAATTATGWISNCLTNATRSFGMVVMLMNSANMSAPMRMRKSIEVVRAPHRVNLVRNPHMAYFTILRQKLHWGER